MLHNDLNFDFTLLPWNIEAAMSAMLFFCIGNLFVKRFQFTFIQNIVIKHKIGIIISCIVAIFLFVIGALYNGQISLGSNNLGKNSVLLYINGFIGIAIILTLSAFLEIDKTYLGKKLKMALQFIGRHSFDYMAVQIPI